MSEVSFRTFFGPIVAEQRFDDPTLMLVFSYANSMDLVRTFYRTCKFFRTVLHDYAPLHLVLKASYISNLHISRVVSRFRNLHTLTLETWDRHARTAGAQQRLADSSIVFALSQLRNHVHLILHANVTDGCFIELLNECSRVGELTLHGVISPMAEGQPDGDEEQVITEDSNLDQSLPQYIDAEVPDVQPLSTLERLEVKLNRIGYFVRSGVVLSDILAVTRNLRALSISVTTLGARVRISEFGPELLHSLAELTLVGVEMPKLKLTQTLEVLDLRDISFENGIEVARGTYQMRSLTLIGDSFPSSFHFNDLLIYCKRLEQVHLSTSNLSFSTKTAELLALNAGMDRLVLGNISFDHRGLVKVRKPKPLFCHSLEMTYFHPIKDFLSIARTLVNVEVLDVPFVNVVDCHKQVLALKKLRVLSVSYGSIRASPSIPSDLFLPGLVRLRTMFDDVLYSCEDFLFLALAFPMVRFFEVLGEMPKIIQEERDVQDEEGLIAGLLESPRFKRMAARVKKVTINVIRSRADAGVRGGSNRLTFFWGRKSPTRDVGEEALETMMSCEHPMMQKWQYCCSIGGRSRSPSSSPAVQPEASEEGEDSDDVGDGLEVVEMSLDDIAGDGL